MLFDLCFLVTSYRFWILDQHGMMYDDLLVYRFNRWVRQNRQKHALMGDIFFYLWNSGNLEGRSAMKKVVKLTEYRKKKRKTQRRASVKGSASKLSISQMIGGLFLLAVLVVFVYLLLTS
ncbi:hypothetical protein [Desulfoluna sp.]|uniref:hypothetical protein n=1 Tax=Desulfoluna sp. TaxID=2045199 RepID=UPI0026130009|nr:hypothetical protein [Desulfoluna sp.]